MEKAYYTTWKSQFNVKTTQPSSEKPLSFEENTLRFLGIDENSSKPLIPIQHQQKISDLKNKTSQMFIRSDGLYNPDKRTVGVFYEPSNVNEPNKDEVVDVERKSRASNSIFNPKTYTNNEFRANLMKTTTNAEHHEGQFIGEPKNKEFNLRRTVISAYSNAKHNQTVFINPRFMSC